MTGTADQEPGNREDRRKGAAAGHSGYARRRPQKRSPRRIVFRILWAVVVLAVIGSGLWWLRTAETFAITRVESGDYRFTDEASLEEILGRFLGRNIWSVDTAEVETALAELPWVRDLTVRRRLPAAVEVDFREWRPLLEVDRGATGTATSDDRVWVLVEDGRILPFPPQLVLAGLPVLTGAVCEVDSLGECHLAAGGSGSVLELVAAMEASGLESISPVDFVVARDGGFAIVLQGGLGRLLVGKEDFADRLNRYMEAHVHLEPGLIVDLRFADRVTCRRPQ